MSKSDYNNFYKNGVEYVRLRNGDEVEADVFYRILSAAEAKGRESAGDIREIEVTYQGENQTLLLGNKAHVKSLFTKMDRDITRLKKERSASDEDKLREEVEKLEIENEGLYETNLSLRKDLDSTRLTFKIWRDRMRNDVAAMRNSIAALEQRALIAEEKVPKQRLVITRPSVLPNNAQCYAIVANLIQDYARQNRMKIDELFFDSMRSGRIPPEDIAAFLNANGSRTRKGQAWTKMSVLGALNYIINQLRKRNTLSARAA